MPHTLHVQTKKETGCRGAKFLPNTGVADLKRAYKKETDPRRRDRLLAYSVNQKFLRVSDLLQINFIASSLGRAVLKYSDIAWRMCTTVA